VFLKVLLEGKGSLYLFEDQEIRRFFYSVDKGEIFQLVYKKYQVDKNHVGENNYFRQQLFNVFNCPDTSIDDLKRISYNRKDLLDFLISYNECKQAEYAYFKLKDKKDLFHFTLRPGMKMITIDFIEKNFAESTEFRISGGTGIRFGAEFETVLPFNKNKWSLFIEPSFQIMDAVGPNISVEYQSIEIPFGFRYYLFLNDRSKFFANISYLVDIPLNSTLRFRNADFNISKSTNFGFGIGYKYNEKYSVEIRYNTERDILSDFILFDAQFSSFSFIAGYSIK
jgi:hypothetical protein